MKQDYQRINKKHIASKNNGITIIALVITIIIMLILSVVAIGAINGGLFENAGTAKKEMAKVDGLEKLQSLVLMSYNQSNILDINKLKINLKTISNLTTDEGETINDNTEIDLPMAVVLDGNSYLIKSTGNVIAQEPGRVEIYDVAKHPERYYGMYVTNYNSPSDEGIADEEGQLGKWQIFVADKYNIYLIASNFINYDYAPTKNNKAYTYDTTIEDTSTVYKMWWNTGLLSEYSGENAVTLTLSKFNTKTRNNYHKWLNNHTEYSQGAYGKMAIMNMLDTDIWSIYNNTTYGEYAIGGPTLEMFCSSYNSTHTTYTLTPKENYDWGYKIQTNDNADATGANLINKGAINDLVDKMLFSNSIAGKYHLASTSAYYSANSPWFYYVSDTSVSGGFCVWGNSYTGGFRPVVCLKSNIHLIENKDENNNITYQIELD